METVTVSEAKKKLSELLCKVENMNKEFIIRRRNRNIALLIPFNENYHPSKKLNLDVIEGFREIRKNQKPLDCTLKEFINSFDC